MSVPRRAVLFSVLTVLLLTALCAVLFLRPNDNGAPNTGRDVPVTFTVGGTEYALTVTGARLGEPSRVQPEDTRLLRTRTVTNLLLLNDALPEGTDATVGMLTVTLDTSDEGSVLYFDCKTEVPITAMLSFAESDGLTVREVAYGDTVIRKPETPLPAAPYSADSALYLESAASHLYLSRIASLRELGQTVFVREVPATGVSLRLEDNVQTVSIPFPKGRTVCTGIATAQPLINWDAPDAEFNVKNLDAGADDYHLIADGVYAAMPRTYRPHAGTDEPHIYRISSALLLGPTTYESNGPMYTALGKSILYLYLDMVNDAGFIPTYPSSIWLSEEYGIGPGFYDTRFNADTAKRLMRAEEVWNDPAIGKAVRRMLDFYCDFADAHTFTANEADFVQDYGSFDGSFAPNRSACALNHYLTEGLLLLRAGIAYDNSEYTKRGYKIMDALNESAGRWIRPNGDLWYAIRPDGQMEKNDYLDVTYLDLVDACALLNKLGKWTEYESIQALLATKEEWLIDHGYRNVTRPHADYTAF